MNIEDESCFYPVTRLSNSTHCYPGDFILKSTPFRLHIESSLNNLSNRQKTYLWYRGYKKVSFREVLNHPSVNKECKRRLCFYLDLFV